MNKSESPDFLRGSKVARFSPLLNKKEEKRGILKLCKCPWEAKVPGRQMSLGGKFSREAKGPGGKRDWRQINYSESHDFLRVSKAARFSPLLNKNVYIQWL